MLVSVRSSRTIAEQQSEECFYIPIEGINMSVSGIFGSSYSSNQISSQYQQCQLTNSEFQQLGQDLASGNLSAAQSDFAILQQAFGQTSTSSSSSTSASATSASSSSNSITQAFQQLSSDLNSGNLTAAQKDYSMIQQDMQSQFGGHLHNHHRMRVGSGGGNEFNELNQLLQDSSSSTSSTGSVSAQQQYAMLAQQLQQLALGDSAATSMTATNPVSLIA